MTAPPDPPDLADLHAYADGLLTGSRAVAVEEALERDPTAAAQVEAWHRLNARIRAAYGGRAAEARPPPGTVRTADPTRGWAHRPAWAAAVLLALSTAAAAGWVGRGVLAPPPRAMDLAAREALDGYQLHAAAAEPEALDAALGSRLGAWLDHDIVVPDLATFSLRLAQAGRLRTLTGAPAVALTYADLAGDRYVLYLVQSLPPDIPAVGKVGEPDGRSTLYWPYEEYRCVLQARAGGKRLRAIAHAIDAQLREAEEAGERAGAARGHS